jgi:hypothetical protein
MLMKVNRHPDEADIYRRSYDVWSVHATNLMAIGRAVPDRGKIPASNATHYFFC